MLTTLETELARLDREQAFLLYATFCGDVVRTAASLGVSPAAVARVAGMDGWTARLAPIVELHRSADPAAVERAINRALNYVQAHRLRVVAERAVRELFDLSPEELLNRISEKSEADGRTRTRPSAKLLADLATAVEKAQALTYLALGDSVSERVKRAPQADAPSASALHAAIASAVGVALGSSSPHAMLLDAQIDAAESCRQPRAGSIPVESCRQALAEPIPA